MVLIESADPRGLGVSRKVACCPKSILFEYYKWLFFQNAIQLQPHGGKNHIVLYQEMWLQSWLHFSKLLSAATSQQFNWSGPRPGT